MCSKDVKGKAYNDDSDQNALLDIGADLYAKIRKSRIITVLCLIHMLIFKVFYLPTVTKVSYRLCRSRS